MKLAQASVFLGAIILLATIGCRGGGQIYNVKDAQITTATGKAVTMDQAAKAIIEAGTGLKWSMAVAKPGHIVATLNVRKHQAIVDITYTTKSYSITYKDSTELNYDAERKTIHENYRSWIQNLDNAIRSRLTAAGA